MPIIKNRFSCENLDDWKKYLSKHSKWKKAKAIEMLEELGPDARAFYKSFSHWLSRNFEVRDAAIIKGQIFPAREADFSQQRNGREGSNKFACYSLRAWWQYKITESAWEGKSSAEMIRLDAKAKSFYYTFYTWLRKNNKITTQNRRLILNYFFPNAKKEIDQKSLLEIEKLMQTA